MCGVGPHTFRGQIAVELNMEKMYEVLRFVEKGTECQPSIDCLQGELLIYYLRDNRKLDIAVLI